LAERRRGSLLSATATAPDPGEATKSKMYEDLVSFDRRTTSVHSVLIVPLVVVSVVAVGCAVSDGEAGQRGQTTRLEPARLRELELTYHIPALVREACAGARRQAAVRVVCPPLVPDVPLTRSEGLWGSIVPHDEPLSYMLTFNNGGLPGGKRHWIVGGGKARAVEKWVLTDFDNVVKGNPVLARTTTVRGHQVSISHFPPYPAGGPNGGHWAAFIHVGDEIVFASPHERRYVDAAVEMALALAEELEAA
jgi:hypothetical protein